VEDYVLHTPTVAVTRLDMIAVHSIHNRSDLLVTLLTIIPHPLARLEQESLPAGLPRRHPHLYPSPPAPAYPSSLSPYRRAPAYTPAFSASRAPLELVAVVELELSFQL
jgi:hypothetical protein